MENCILFGNGFNLLIGKAYPSWNDLICGSEEGAAITSASYPLRYEVAMAGKSKKAKDKSKIRIQTELKEIVRKILTDEDSDIELYEKIAEMKFSDYLTTNYDNFLYRFFQLRKNYKLKEQDRTEHAYNVRRRYVISNGERTISIWNIHGDVENFKSMVIGYNHYCGCIWKLTNYIKGDKYIYKRSDGQEDLIKKPIAQRLFDGVIVDEKRKDIHTWADQFFTENIHIIGLSLSFDEMDIWWLLYHRLHVITKDKTKIKNKIYYYDILFDSDKTKALQAFGVTVVHVEPEYIRKDPDGNITNWKELYLRLVEMMEKNME